MENIILKIRDLINDAQKTNGRDSFDYEYSGQSQVFTLNESNISSATIVVKKNQVIWASTPITGTTVAWTRALTVITITKVNHGLLTGDSITVTVSSDATALPLGTKTITKLTDNTFTVVGLNAGTTSGTCTYTGVANYSFDSSTCELTVSGSLTVGDNLYVTYSFYEKYSDTELQGWIRAAISYLVVEKYKTFAIKPPTIIFPTPNEDEEQLLSIIAAILIKGDIVSYKTPEITLNFERGDNKETKIKKIIRHFKKSSGYLCYIDLTENTVINEDED